jgi:Cdc6-like AAA superfamily ATPase
MKRKEINEVFTPRNEFVNTLMYIDRNKEEKNLYRSVTASMHSFLCGESGSGKTWLYKKVFEEKRIKYIAINAANASRKKSITKELYDKCFDSGDPKKVGYKETKKAGVSVGVIAELVHEGEFVIPPEDKLRACYKELYERSAGGNTIIVLDNVETLFSND